MGSYTFKSVGTTTDAGDTTVKRSVLPIGIKTPFEPGDGQLFKMRYDMPSVVRDNFRNLIMTNWGERLGTYDFGANLRPVLSEWVSLEDFDSKAMGLISNAVSKWMPYVAVKEYESHMTTINANVLAVRLKVTYDVAQLDVSDAGIEVTLQVM